MNPQLESRDFNNMNTNGDEIMVQWLMMEMIRSPPSIPMAVNIGALLLVPPPVPF
jgi:hypothetical protein